MEDKDGAFKGMRAVLRSVFGTNESATHTRPPRDLTAITRQIEEMGSTADRVKEAIAPAGNIHEAMLLITNGKAH